MTRPPHWPDYCAHTQSADYAARVLTLEVEGLTTSDAQGVADAEWLDAWRKAHP